MKVFKALVMAIAGSTVVLGLIHLGDEYMRVGTGLHPIVAGFFAALMLIATLFVVLHEVNE